MAGVVVAGVGRTGGYGVPMAFGRGRNQRKGSEPVAGPYRVYFVNPGQYRDHLNLGCSDGWKLVSTMPLGFGNSQTLMVTWDTRGPA